LLSFFAMSGENMLSIEELNRMQDLSSPALYRAEVQRIPFIAREEQPVYIEAAQTGDQTAQHELILNCLNWTMRRARAIHREREPEHTDVMDLVGQANMKMVEAVPNALMANDPVAYLMSVGAWEMHRYCTYQDPLIKRPRDKPVDAPHPVTVGLEDNSLPVSEMSPQDVPEYQVVYNALAQLSKRHQIVLMAAYGLNGEARRSNEDIGLMLNLPKETVETYLWRAKRKLAEKLAPYAGELGLTE
jgi:RNA polymerase sigma factor (sigma-70 family)